MSGSVANFLLPWEHYVCSECLADNPYAIWLVKVQCFQPHRHQEPRPTTLVVIDHQQMAMVITRPLPDHYNRFRGQFVQCWNYPDCVSEDACDFAHLRCELHNWNLKKQLLLRHPELLEGAAVWDGIHILSDICLHCFQANPGQTSLAWLQCVDPDEHTPRRTVSVIASLPKRRLVVVRRTLPTGYYCRYVEERDYHQWLQAMTVATQDPEYPALSDLYGYPEEASSCVQVDIQKELSRQSYKSKFHKLVYLEELASSRKMIRECDTSEVTIQSAHFDDSDYDSRANATFPVYLTDLSSSAMDYASHHEAEVEIKLFTTHQIFSAPIEDKPDYDRNALILRMHYHSAFFKVGGIQEGLKASVHFKNSPRHFHNLHESISSLDDTALEKLLPASCFSSDPLKKLHISQFKLDPKYQLTALKKMLSCNPLAPYLLLGPFGTGKSFALAAIVSYLLQDSTNRVLVCTHLNRGADGLYQLLQKRIGYTKTASNVVRLGKVNAKPINRGINRTLDELLRLDEDWPVVISTFAMASHLRQRDTNSVIADFTHVLVDEGAQCPEPEAIGALVWANKKTHVMIVGDNQQVGPKVRVVSDLARSHGLGDSLLERLYSHYKQHPRAVRTHTSTLLTNYRCHPSILTLASSLFYECTLLSYSSSKAHPRTPFPLVFACTSLDDDEDGFADRQPSCEREAQLLIGKMFELIKTWHVQAPQPRPVFGLLGSNKQQVACLRKVYARMKHRHNIYGHVEIMPTYNIQGEEFDAVFLSTSEPTTSEGYPSDPIKSICNRYVFNTVITRAKSLVFVAGNPFLLHHMCSNLKPNCWAEFIRRCIQCHSIQLPGTNQDFEKFPRQVEKLRELVLMDNINEIAMKELDAVESDTIIERYISDLSDRQEFKRGTKLVQDPTGNMEWVQEETESGGVSKPGVVWCTIDCKDYRTAKAVPTQPGQKPISLESLKSRRLAFHGDKVLVDTIKKCVLLDEEMEKAIAQTHFGATFLCRVDPNSATRFYPVDRRYPKFVNLPMISCRTRAHSGVICFHPSSINDIPKPDNFIPLECAVKMLFIVKFLSWTREFPYPLGIIVGALPFSGHSIEEGELILRVSNGIPLFPCQASIPRIPPSSQNHSVRIFKDAFTIDPEGATDHDDALTVRRILQSRDSKEEVFEIGVHITNVQKYIPPDTALDKEARERGCSAYRSSDHCISRMLPDELIKKLSITSGSECHTLSVVFTLSAKEGRISIDKTEFVESRVSSSLELTYKEAQALICNPLDMPLDAKLARKLGAYDHKVSSGLRIKEQLSIAWRVAVCLRKGRLGEAANSLEIDDTDKQQCPEAHTLIEELMVTTNQVVAQKLRQHFPAATIVRTQGKPSEEAIKMLSDQCGKLLATSPTMQAYLPAGPTASPEYVTILQTTFTKVTSSLAQGRVREALHCIQFENQHPQSAVAVASLREIRSPTAYVVTKQDKSDYWHDSLRCKAYTHFTSPIRRYIDIIAQRMLVAAINGEPCPYGDGKELEAICEGLTNAVKKSNAYGRDVSNLDLAFELSQRSEEYIAFIFRVEDNATIHFIFPDPKAKVLLRRQKSVHLRNLNASHIEQPTAKESTPPPGDLQAVAVPRSRRPPPARRSRRSPTPVPSTDTTCTWVVKVSSFTSNAGSFLTNPGLELSTSAVNAHAKVSFFISDSGNEILKDSNLREKELHFSIKPLTCTLSYPGWKEALKSVTKEPKDVNHLALRASLQPVRSLAPAASSPEVDKFKKQPSSLWIYKVSRPIQQCEVLKLQLAATNSSRDLMLEPCIQLLEAAPEVKICIQHNANPSECYVTRLTENASKSMYPDLNEYFDQWEKVLIAEGATTSMAECELLLVKDVKMKWPVLEKVMDSSGASFYKLPAITDKRHGVKVEVPESFLQSSYAFMRFEQGDLLCVRYSVRDEKWAKLNAVFHMVIHYADKVFSDSEPKVLTQLTLYLKFVGDASNSISIKMGAVLSGTSALPCEVQLIPLTLPYRRIYRSLSQLQRREGTTALAEAIALGTAGAASHSCPDLKDLLSSEQASLATSLWPLRPRIRGSGSGRAKLNKYQKKAIGLAYSNNFTLIQGPPGTGKSVTGAHLAYALAMKLNKERSSGSIGSGSAHSGSVRVRPGSARQREPKQLHPCVMYCGPSQQSVNVVLEMLIAQDSPVKDKLRILRIFSKGIEKKKYPGAESHSSLFRNTITDSKCSPDHEPYALHCLVRQRNPNIAALDREFEQLHKNGKIPSWSKREQYTALIHETEVKVINEGVDIVLCTCNEASSHRVLRSVQPQCCIVDECAMATEPECMVPIRRAKHVVLIGDHQQLSPVIQNRNASENGLNCSLFERYVKYTGTTPLMLEIQYRMHPEICKFPSQEFYDGRLKSDFSVTRRSDKEALLNDFWPRGKAYPFVFCHVVGREGETHTGQKERAKVGLESKFNTDEAMKIADLAHVLVTKHRVPVSKLAALTPYSAQRVELRKRLERRGLEGVTVKTITESQGSEFGIVLLSMVRSKENVANDLKADIGWKRANLGFIMERSQICVAITRCKFGLIIVGNKKLLSYCDTWDRLIQHYQKHGCVVDGRSFP